MVKASISLRRITLQNFIDFHSERKLIATIAVDIDTNLNILSCKKGVKMPEHKIRNLDYNQVYDEAVRQIYYVIAGRGCPELEK
jgi:hypothetical protein